MNVDSINIRGFVRVYKNGELAHEGNNVVVQTGKYWIASRIAEAPSPTPNPMAYMALGTGTVSAVTGDTALGNELARVGIPSSTWALNQAIYTGTFDAGVATGALTEAGIFDSVSGGTMLARYTFPVVNKDAADYVTIYWSIQVL